MSSKDGAEALADLRSRLDHVDRTIATAVAERFRLVRSVGELKRASGIAVMQEARVGLVLDRAAQSETELDIPAGTLTTLFAALIEESCRLEEAIEDPAIG